MSLNGSKTFSPIKKRHSKEWHCYQWHPLPLTSCLPLRHLQAEKDKILKLSAEILRLEKAVQEEKTQSQVFKTELAREKDSSLVRHPASQEPQAGASRNISAPSLCLGCGLRSAEHSLPWWAAFRLQASQPSLVGNLPCAFLLSAHILGPVGMTQENSRVALL